jgi:H+/gluconate symporter-like permease
MSVSSSPGPSASVAATSLPQTGQVQLAPGVSARIRNPIVVAVLAIVTFGIYIVFWHYFVNRELADYGRARRTGELGTNPTRSVLALFPGALIVVPAIWTTVTTFQRIQAAQRLNAQTAINGWLGLVLFLVFSPAFYGYMQSGLNSAWRASTDAS